MPSGRTLKIHRIQLLQQDLPSFNFNQTDPNIMKSTTYQCKYHPNMMLYVYSNSNTNTNTNIGNNLDIDEEQIIISNTMDHTSSLKFLFAVKIQENYEEFRFCFFNIQDIVKMREWGKSAEAMKDRLERGKIKDYNDSQMYRHKNQDKFLLQCQKIPDYFYPRCTQSPQIFLVPRYMHLLELSKGMRFHFHCKTKQAESQQIVKTTCKITQLSLVYVIEEVKLQQIVNNTSLPIENQCNLLHLCEDILINQPKQEDCIICLQSQVRIPKNTKTPNFLIDPCNCKGSCKYVHFKCLACEINTQYNKFIQCRTCKKPYPQYLQFCEVTRIQSNQKLSDPSPSIERTYRYFNILGGNNSPYICIQDEKIELFTNSKIIIGTQLGSNYIIPSKEQVKFGSIKYDIYEQKAYIQDLKSDFGTLVSMDEAKVILKKGVEPYTCSIVVEKVLYYFTIQKCSNK